MCWENRNRCNRYYYGGRRQGNQVIKEYLGRGIAAALIAATLLKQKEQRNALWKKRRDLLHCLRVTNRLNRSVFQFSKQIEKLLRFIEKGANKGILAAPSPEEPMTSQLELPIQPAIEEIITRAKHGDLEALPQVRQLIEQKPRLWQHMIDLSREAQETQINALAGDDQLLRAAIRSKVSALRKELGDGSSNALEQIVIERILISWLQVQHTDLLLAKTAPNDFRFTKLLLKRADQCQGRLQRAITQLQTMRKPSPPKSRKKTSPAAVS